MTTPETTPKTTRTSLKALVQGAYDVQDLRIKMGNRICAAYYQAHGVSPGEKPKEKMDAENQKILANATKEYKRVAAGITRIADSKEKRRFTPSQYLPEYTVLQLCGMHQRLEEQEALAFKDVGLAVMDFPIYQQFLASVRGCGAAMSGVLIAYLDIHRAPYPSQFWAAAGLDVAPDGRGRSRRKEHLVVRQYKDAEGHDAKRLSITFNPLLKTKLFVLASCLMRNDNAYYRGIYDNYKHRLESHPNWTDKTPAHRNNAARRYMLKIFLANLWRAWRALEGLPVVPTYAEAKLGMPPHHRNARDLDQGPQDIAAE